MNKRKFMRFIFILCTWIAFIVTGITYLIVSRKQDIHTINNLTKKEQVIKKENVVIYTPNAGSTSLEKSNVEIEASESPRDKIQRVVTKNIELLGEKGLLKKNKIELNNVYIVDDTVYISFNLSINELEPENKKNTTIITSIVNSITEIPNIQRVKFLVNGGDGVKSLKKFYSRNLDLK